MQDLIAADGQQSGMFKGTTHINNDLASLDNHTVHPVVSIQFKCEFLILVESGCVTQRCCQPGGSIYIAVNIICVNQFIRNVHHGVSTYGKSRVGVNNVDQSLIIDFGITQGIYQFNNIIHGHRSIKQWSHQFRL